MRVVAVPSVVVKTLLRVEGDGIGQLDLGRGSLEAGGRVARLDLVGIERAELGEEWLGHVESVEPLLAGIVGLVPEGAGAVLEHGVEHRPCVLHRVEVLRVAGCRVNLEEQRRRLHRVLDLRVVLRGRLRGRRAVVDGAVGTHIVVDPLLHVVVVGGIVRPLEQLLNAIERYAVRVLPVLRRRTRYRQRVVQAEAVGARVVLQLEVRPPGDHVIGDGHPHAIVATTVVGPSQFRDLHLVDLILAIRAREHCRERCTHQQYRTVHSRTSIPCHCRDSVVEIRWLGDIPRTATTPANPQQRSENVTRKRSE